MNPKIAAPLKGKIVIRYNPLGVPDGRYRAEIDRAGKAAPLPGVFETRTGPLHRALCALSMLPAMVPPPSATWEEMALAAKGIGYSVEEEEGDKPMTRPSPRCKSYMAGQGRCRLQEHSDKQRHYADNGAIWVAGAKGERILPDDIADDDDGDGTADDGDGKKPSASAIEAAYRSTGAAQLSPRADRAYRDACRAAGRTPRPNGSPPSNKTTTPRRAR